MKKKVSALEEKFAQQLHEFLPDIHVEREYKGIIGRQFRFDFAIIPYKIAIEIHGGQWLGWKGGHTSGVGVLRDCEKACMAALNGWVYFPISGEHVKSGAGIGWIKQYIDQKV